MRFTTQLAAIGSISALALSSFSFAAPIPWTNPNGSNSEISWANGESDSGLFGSPTIVGTSFLFFPNNFEANASDGSSQTTSDRLSFTLTAAQGKQIEQITFKELGDWTILGIGAVKASGALFVTQLNSPGFATTYVDTMDVVYTDVANNTTINGPAAFPNSTGNGTWEGVYTINLPDGVTSVQIVMNNIMQAVTTGQGSTANIEKKVIGPGTQSPTFTLDVFVPEPASLGVLFMGAAALLRRSRRTSSN
jgi:hypothetical protein